MRQKRRDNIVQRYLSGEMNPSEQERFLLRLRRDGQLRRTLEVNRSLYSAMRKERSLEMLPDAESRARILSMLGSSSAVDTAPGGGAMGQGTAAQGGSGWLAALESFKLVGALVSIAAVTTALFVLPSEKNPDRSPSVQERPAAQAPILDTSHFEPPRVVPAPSVPAPEARASGTKRTEPVAPASTVKEPKNDRAEIHSTQAREADAVPTESKHDPAAKRVVVDRDTARVRMKFEPPK